MLRRLPLAGLLLVPLLSAPAGAELVILDGGAFFKASSYQVAGEQIRVGLPDGGSVTLPLGRVERVVEDEIVPAPEPIGGIAGLDLGFAESQAVPAGPFGDLIYRVARNASLNPALLAAVIRAESAYDRSAVSNKGARGLMQLMPATARRFGVAASRLFDPESNLTAGAAYLSWLRDRFGDDLPKILAAYNAGEQTVDRFDGVPPYRETRAYLERVLGFLGIAAAEPAVAVAARR